MKKKIETLLKQGRLSGNVEYKTLHKTHQTAKRSLERAKKGYSKAKEIYQNALEQGEKGQDRLFELLTALRQAKCMRGFHRAANKLVKYRLHRWLENFLKNSEVPHAPEKKQAVKVKNKKLKPAKTAKTDGKTTPKPAKKAV